MCVFFFFFLLSVPCESARDTCVGVPPSPRLLAAALLSHFTPACHIPDYLRRGHIPPLAAAAAATTVLVGRMIWQHEKKKSKMAATH